jgi:hypothetical protein
LERQFDACETQQVVEPVDGLKRHSKGTAPSTKGTGHGIVLRSWRGRTEDRVDDRGSAPEGKTRTCAGFIEHRGQID